MKRGPKKPRAELPDEDAEIVGEEGGLEDMLKQLGALGTDPSELTDVLDLTPTGEWVRSSGRTPVEFLTLVYRHPLVAMKDRISAAGKVMDFVHRKLPASLEVSGKDGAPVRLDSDMLSKLSAKELDMLEKLLLKAQGEAK